MFTNSLYYHLKPFIPRRLQIEIRRQIVLRKRERCSHIWPIDERAGNPPEGWTGWPDGKKFALVLTHDVESAKGVEKVIPLAELEMKLGFRSSFNFVAEDYRVPDSVFDYLRNNGFEIGVHGLSHNGNLFDSWGKFEKKTSRINRYIKEWKASGFRTPSIYHNLEWISHLDIGYDSSTFDTDPFEPQPDGVGTIFPFWVPGRDGQKGYVELPYTLPQDFTLFVLMAEKGIDIWKRKLDWIAEKGGTALLITHPDYMGFGAKEYKTGKYSFEYYGKFLKYVKDKNEGNYWNALPQEVTNYCLGNPSLKKVNTKKYKPKLHACMVNYSFYENDGRVKRYAETLAARGDRVDVISLRKKGQPSFEVIKNVNVYRIQGRVPDEKGKLSYLERVVRFLIHSSLFLLKEHLKNPYHLIHVHSVPDFEVFAGFLPKLTGAKLILDIHDIVPEFYASKFSGKDGNAVSRALIAVEKASIRFSDHVIISNHIWEKKLVSRSVSSDKCTVILNYPDPAIFSARARTRGDDKFIMMYPGTLNWHQGLDLAIKAFSMIKEKAPEAEFHIYGRGSELENLKRLAESLNVRDRVLFKNPLDIEQIADKMLNVDLGIVPKRNDLFGGEAFSTKILEFMALGVPVIAAATKIDRFYFNDSVLKFFKPEDEEDLARCMMALVRDKSERERLSANALKFVHDYTWGKKKQDYLDLVDRLVGSK